MPKIIYTQDVVYPDNSANPVTVHIDLSGCTVDYLDTQTDVTWDQLPDVEYLADLFGDVTVKAFKVIVRMFGKIYNNKSTYLELLE
jgi:hypothetical protein